MSTIPVYTYTSSRVKIYITNEWNTEDFITLLDSFNRLYFYHYHMGNMIQAFNEKNRQYINPERTHSLPENIIIRNKFKKEFILILSKDSDYKSVRFNEEFMREMLLLQVIRIQYSSPGSIDIVGIGKIFEIIKDFVLHYFPSNDRKIETKLKERDIELKEQEIIGKKIDNLKSMGFTLGEIQTLIGLEYYQVDKLKGLIEAKKLVNIEINTTN